MDWKLICTEEKIILMSRKSFILNVLFFFASILIGILIENQYLQSNLLIIIGYILIGISSVIFAINYIMPILFIVLGYPQLAHAWLRGTSPTVITSTPWRDMSALERGSIYFHSIVSFVMITFVVIFIFLFNQWC